MKQFFVCILALFLVTFFSLGSLLAADICVNDNTGGQFRFKNVKPLKKPGQLSPLSGIYISGDTSAPVSGTAFVKTDGTISMGFLVYYIDEGSNFSVSLNGSTFDTATGFFSNGPDVENKGDFAFIGSFRCKDTVLP